MNLIFVFSLLLLGVTNSRGQCMSNPGCANPGYIGGGGCGQLCPCWNNCGNGCPRPPGNEGGNEGNTNLCPHGMYWYNLEGQFCVCQTWERTPYYKCESMATTAATTTTPAPPTSTAAGR